MSNRERWARIQDQIDLLREARFQGGMCASCGREFADGEPVYVERFRRGSGRRWLVEAPVGIECASPELIELAKVQAPRPCFGCGRPVFYRHQRANRGRGVCSHWCVRRRVAALRRAERQD